MSAIGPGDLVVCVDDGPPPGWLGPKHKLRVAKGRAYRVVHAFPSLAGISFSFGWNEPATLSGGYGAWRFRKLNDGTDDAELIAAIKSCRPIKQQEPEHA